MLLNRKTEAWCEAYIVNPQSSLLLDSPDDIETAIILAQHIHSKIIRSNKRPLVRVTLGDKKSIGVDDVRAFQKSLSLKADFSDNDSVSRMALIEHAELLTSEAQNALLKLLEDLPNRTIVVLASSQSEKLVDTIKSRCMTIPVLPISETQAVAYAEKNGFKADDAKRAHLLSEGRRTLFTQFIENDEPMQALVTSSKRFIAASVLDRQKIVESILKRKEDVEIFLQSLLILTKSGMRSAKDTNGRLRWKNALTEVLQTRELIARNVSPKLALLDLSIHL